MVIWTMVNFGGCCQKEDVPRKSLRELRRKMLNVISCRSPETLVGSTMGESAMASEESSGYTNINF